MSLVIKLVSSFLLAINLGQSFAVTCPDASIVDQARRSNNSNDFRFNDVNVGPVRLFCTTRVTTILPWKNVEIVGGSLFCTYQQVQGGEECTLSSTRSFSGPWGPTGRSWIPASIGQQCILSLGACTFAPGGKPSN